MWFIVRLGGLSLPCDEDHAYSEGFDVGLLGQAPPPSELPPPNLSHLQVPGYLSYKKHEAPIFTKENRHDLLTLPRTHGEGTSPGF